MVPGLELWGRTFDGPSRAASLRRRDQCAETLSLRSFLRANLPRRKSRSKLDAARRQSRKRLRDAHIGDESYMLPAFDRDALQRIDAVRIALHDNRRGQHHRKHHACEDETYQSQAVAICHRFPRPFFLRRSHYWQDSVGLAASTVPRMPIVISNEIVVA